MPQSLTAEPPDVDPQWLQEVIDSTQALIDHSRLLRQRSQVLIQSAMTLREQLGSTRFDTERLLLNPAA